MRFWMEGRAIRVDLGGWSHLPACLRPLAPLRDRYELDRERSGLPSLPYGWCWRHEPGRDSAALVPWWLAAIGWLWTQARWDALRIAVRVGFLRLKEEGGYFADCTWTWRWGSAIAFRFSRARRYVKMSPGWWERLGHRVEGVINDFQAHDRTRWI